MLGVRPGLDGGGVGAQLCRQHRAATLPRQPRHVPAVDRSLLSDVDVNQELPRLAAIAAGVVARPRLVISGGFCCGLRVCIRVALPFLVKSVCRALET